MIHYTTGYTGQKVDSLPGLLEILHAVLFDIRYAANSRAPQWRGPVLKALLGERYRHVPALGNRNYKGGPIEIADMIRGLATISESPRPVVLMCGCPDVRHCHRLTVGAALLRQPSVDGVFEIGDWNWRPE